MRCGGHQSGVYEPAVEKLPGFSYRWVVKKAVKSKRVKSLDPRLRADGSRRAPMETLLIQIGQANGCRVREVSFETLARTKARSRTRDRKLIQTGQATPEQVQAKNYPFSEGIVIGDLSRSLAP